jgi:hypothetical protein
MREQSKDANYAYIESSCMCVKNMSNRVSVNVCGACFVPRQTLDKEVDHIIEIHFFLKLCTTGL